MNLTMNNRRITVQQLKNYVDSQTPHLIIDIRPRTEFDICRLKSSWLILLCHRGNKSAEAAPHLSSALSSFRKSDSESNIKELASVDDDTSNHPDFIVCDVAGGLSAWALEIDPNFPTY
ncbi:unnamed protein product [Trichobilharzia regenti]|nr:unnamed protein product [Trichobilharzia regenti]